jgi:hypothetical protein
LEEVDLRGNALAAFPSPVTRLTRLRLLDLTSAGAIASVPEGIGELTALTELALGDVGVQVGPDTCALCTCGCLLLLVWATYLMILYLLTHHICLYTGAAHLPHLS